LDLGDCLRIGKSTIFSEEQVQEQHQSMHGKQYVEPEANSKMVTACMTYTMSRANDRYEAHHLKNEISAYAGRRYVSHEE
jgi:hypothetical protein